MKYLRSFLKLLEAARACISPKHVSGMLSAAVLLCTTYCSNLLGIQTTALSFSSRMNLSSHSSIKLVPTVPVAVQSERLVQFQ